MARAKKKEAATDFNPAEFDPAMQTEVAAEGQGTVAVDNPQQSTEAGFASQHAPSSEGHAAGVQKKTYTKPTDPFGFENIKAGENRVRLLKSEGEGAYVIRFAHNPNLDKGVNGETFSKENPHPVFKMLKDEGYRWGFDGGDGKGGWGKAFTGDAYGADHIEARRVLQQAAEMVGAEQEEGKSR